MADCISTLALSPPQQEVAALHGEAGLAILLHLCLQPPAFIARCAANGETSLSRPDVAIGPAAALPLRRLAS